MEPLERLVAIQEIKNLKARYFRCIDLKQWVELADVFTSDIRLNRASVAGDEAEWLSSREEVLVYMRSALADVTTCHHGHLPEITIQSTETAKGVWPMEDHIWLPDSHPLGLRTIHGYGHYIEEYRRECGIWRIAVRELTRIRVDVEPAQA